MPISVLLSLLPLPRKCAMFPMPMCLCGCLLALPLLPLYALLAFARVTCIGHAHSGGAPCLFAETYMRRQPSALISVTMSVASFLFKSRHHRSLISLRRQAPPASWLEPPLHCHRWLLEQEGADKPGDLSHLRTARGGVTPPWLSRAITSVLRHPSVAYSRYPLGLLTREWRRLTPGVKSSRACRLRSWRTSGSGSALSSCPTQSQESERCTYGSHAREACMRIRAITLLCQSLPVRGSAISQMPLSMMMMPRDQTSRSYHQSPGKVAAGHLAFGTVMLLHPTILQQKNHFGTPTHYRRF